MEKIINSEKDLLTSKKAKRILTSVKAATLAGVIAVSSLGCAHSAQAQAEPVSDFQTELTDELDEKFTWEYDDGINRDSKPFFESAAEEPVQEPVVDVEPVEVTTADPVETETVVVDQDPDIDCKSSGKYVKVFAETNEWEWADEKSSEDPSIEYLLYLNDVDPAIVDENYTGVAPLTYYGPEHVVKNYGDASNDEEVMERATAYWNAFHKANEEAGGLKLYNLRTNKEYTVEEIANVIKYINGAYIANDGVEASMINDDWINFMLVFLNDDYVIEDVNYKANSDVISEEDVKNHSNILENIDLGHLLMGDSANGPFLQWFGDQIKAMYTTTDKDEAIRLYDETYLAIVAITEGNGYIINGVKYTINDFTDVNDLVLDTEVLISQVLRNNMMESGYAFNKKYVGLDLVFLTRVLEQYNAVCSEDLVKELKDGGVEVYEGVTSYENGQDLNLKNYASVMQMKAFNMALSNGQFGIKYYQDNYLSHYDEYIKEKNGGTYEDVLESDYVYKKSK